MLEIHSLPLVLAVGGHDPSGGAGLQADIEAIAANGCRALTVVTALTTQNTCGVRQVLPQPAAQVLEQCRLLLEESRVAAVKIGLLGGAEVARALAGLFAEHPEVPVVLDPVLTSGTGTALAGKELEAAIIEHLLPRCSLITPNSLEARVLAGRRELKHCAAVLTRNGCKAVLITGTHEAGDKVVNRLYGPRGLEQETGWERLPGEYHGSGCTLASATAAFLASGIGLSAAVARALGYTWSCLRHALATGRCQYTPNRFYRLQADEN